MRRKGYVYRHTNYIYNTDDNTTVSRYAFKVANAANEASSPGWIKKVLDRLDKYGWAALDMGSPPPVIIIALVGKYIYPHG